MNLKSSDMKTKSDITPIIIKLIGILNKGKIDYNFKFWGDFITYSKEKKSLTMYIKNPHGFWLNRKLKKEVSRLKCEVDGVHEYKISPSIRLPILFCKHCGKRK
jgi:hypothetical protein